MRYHLVEANGSVKKALTIPAEIIPLKGLSRKHKEHKPKQNKKKRVTKRLLSAKALVNGHHRYKQKSKTK